MATSNRDVKMTLSVDTLGEEGIKSLETEIRKLAKGAGEAAPEFERLADEVAQLSSQAGAVRGLEDLANEVERLGSEQQQAAAKAEELRTKLAQQRDTVTQAADRQRELAAALRDARNALTDTNADLQIARRGTDEAAKGTEAYERAITELIQRKAAEKKAVDDARAALTAANKELSEATAAQKRLTSQTESAEDALTKVGRAIEQQNKALAAGQDELRQYGLSTDDLATAQGELLQRLNASGTAARQQAEALRDAAETSARFAEIAQRNARIEAEAAAARVAAAQRDAEIDKQQEAILQQNLARREAVAQRRAALARETAAAEAAAAERAQAEDAARLREQYAAEEAASNRIIALKREAYARIAALARENAEKEAAAARQAAEALSNAFNTVGVRGAQAIQREIDEVRAAMELVRAKSGETGAAIAGAMRAGEERINALQRELRELTGQLTLADRAADLFRNSMGQIAVGNLIADGIASLVERVKELGRQFIAVNVQAETVSRALNAIYKDSQIAGQQFDFLRRTANNAGISISGIADSFVKFSAATQSSNIPLEQTNALFEAVARAGSTLGLSTERVQLALDALGQIASKGTVSMEELRQQLGDSLPGALSLTAKGLGITDAELIKLVESGRLASRDFFPALTKGLKDLQGTTDGLNQAWARFKNNLTLSAQEAGQAGGVDVLRGALAALNAVVTTLAGAFGALVSVFGLVGRAVGALSGALVTLTNPLSELNSIWNEFVRVNTLAGARIANSVGLLSDETRAIIEKNNALNQGNSVAQQVAQQQSALNELIRQSTANIAANDSGARAAAVAKALDANATLDLGAKYVQLGVAAAELQKQQESEIVVRGKAVKAAQEQGEALVQVAQLRNSEAATVSASLEANRLLVQAQADEARARQGLVEVLAVELAEKTRLAIAQDGNTEARKQELAAIEQKLGLARAEAESSQQELRNLQATASALRLKADVLRDNSLRVGEYRVALANANLELSRQAVQFAQGRISQEQYTKAVEAAARAAGLLKDAINDENRAAQAQIQIKAAQTQVRIAEINAKIEEARASEQIARLNGNEEAANRALTEQKRLGAEVARLSAQAKVEETNATIALLEKQLAEVEGSDDAAVAKRQEIELRILNERAKLAEAKAGEAVVRSLEAEYRAIITRNRAAAQSPRSAGGGGGGGGGGNPLVGGSGGRNDRLNQLFGIENNVGANGLVRDENGRTAEEVARLRQQGGPVDASYNFDVMRRLESGQGFTADELPALLNGLRVSQQNAALGNPGSVSLEGRQDDQRWIEVFRRAVEQAQADANRRGGPSNFGGRQLNPDGSFVNSGGQPLSGVGTGTGTRTITINLGGRSTQINVASDADASNLESIFRQLETAAGRGG